MRPAGIEPASTCPCGRERNFSHSSSSFLFAAISAHTITLKAPKNAPPKNTAAYAISFPPLKPFVCISKKAQPCCTDCHPTQGGISYRANGVHQAGAHNPCNPCYVCQTDQCPVLPLSSLSFVHALFSLNSATVTLTPYFLERMAAKVS